jgi:hypothetical protein
MTTPDTTTPEATVDENAAATATKVVEAEPAASEVTSEAKAETETEPEPEPEASVAEAQAVATPASTETAVAVPSASAETAEEEDPQTTVFSLVTFFLAALPVIGVVLNAIAVARAGKEGFDLWLARWGLALAIIETIGALALVGLGYYLGMLTAGTV